MFSLAFSSLPYQSFPLARLCRLTFCSDRAVSFPIDLVQFIAALGRYIAAAGFLLAVLLDDGIERSAVRELTMVKPEALPA